MKDTVKEREYMVKTQIMARGIHDKGVIRAMKEIPREFFVPESLFYSAYEDSPLPIGFNQTISQPYMAALMTQKLELTGKEKVLEIGTGSGYQTAILAFLAQHVYTMERISGLVQKAEENIKKLNITNITFRYGDGTCGWDEQLSFDRIMVTAGTPDIPKPLTDQLSNDGILVIPVGDSSMQVLKIVRKHKDKIIIEDSTGCIFVKLIGKHGWKTD